MDDETAVIARTRCGRAKHTECCDLLHSRWISSKAERSCLQELHKARILYGSEVRSLKESEIGIF